MCIYACWVEAIWNKEIKVFSQKFRNNFEFWVFVVPNFGGTLNRYNSPLHHPINQQSLTVTCTTFSSSFNIICYISFLFLLCIPFTCFHDSRRIIKFQKKQIKNNHKNCLKRNFRKEFRSRNLSEPLLPLDFYQECDHLTLYDRKWWWIGILWMWNLIKVILSCYFMFQTSSILQLTFNLSVICVCKSLAVSYCV